jgi:hypothetical protein
MQVKFVTLCIAAALCAAPAVSHAQLGNGGATYSEVTGATKWSQVMPMFVDAAQDVLTADSNMLAALGLNAEAAVVVSRSAEMKFDATPGTVEEIMAMHTTAATTLAPKLAGAGVALSDSAKAQFSKGIDGLARGVGQIDAMSGDLPGLKKMMRDAGAKARTGSFVAKSLGQYRKDMKQQLRDAIAFARANGIVFPPEAELLTKE